jgi:tRNA 2-selenouridine synthase
MITNCTIEEFTAQAETAMVLDVRSPMEHEHAHMPNALNLPVFSNEERKIIGTTYKEQSREQAIKLGLDFFGPKMNIFIETIETWIVQKQGTENQPKHLEEIKQTKLLLHCARGGMRSAAVAWLLDFYGFDVYLLTGGYKAYRNHVLSQFEKPYPFKILSGNTGSRKTVILQQLAGKENIIDLETLANHKGSAFGSIGMPAQPSQEMFENLLAGELLRKSADQKPIWLEDESQRIGKAMIPNGIWNQMREAAVYFLEVPFEKRLENILLEYGPHPKEDLKESIHKIAKRLGGLETKTAIQFLEEDDIKNCFSILLTYYDKQYKKGLEKRNNLNHQLTLVTDSFF